MKKRFHHSSFTLIEMLVVVVIIGILAGVLVPRLVGARERASDSARIVKVGQISSAVELYAQENGSKYPLAPLTGAPGISIATPSVTSAISPYLTNIPTDPGKGTVAIQGEPGNIQVTGDSFAYWTDTGGTVYAITALMESKKGNTTNAVGVIDKDKEGEYQVVGKGLITYIVAGGSVDTNIPGVYFVGGDTIVTDGINVYTMMDKNLGASVAGTGTASYGWYFQWGNNFGFWNGTGGTTNQDGSATIATTSTLVSNPSPGYTNSTYGLGKISPNDWAMGQTADLRGSLTNTDIARKGPCPTGYHIPTKEEWQGLYYTWAKIYNSGVANTYINTSIRNLIRDTLLLPLAGSRLYGDAALYYQSRAGYYWSSDPDGVYAIAFYFSPDYVYTSGMNRRANGFSIRCFKDSPGVNAACGTATGKAHITSPTMDLCQNGLTPARTAGTNGTWTWTCPGTKGGTSVSCTSKEIPVCGTANIQSYEQNESIPTPYCERGTSSVETINSATVGAKLWTCTQNSVTVDCSLTIIAPPTPIEPTTPGVHYVGDNIVVKNATTRYVMQDKNLGATQVGIDGTNSAIRGSFFQRGNNYGFPSIGTVSPYSTTAVNTSGYAPSTYSSSTFIGVGNWDSSANSNLRGNITNTNIARKGPCPDGYHVPSQEERVGVLSVLNTLNLGAVKGYLIRDTLKLPMVGGRDYSSPSSFYYDPKNPRGGYYSSKKACYLSFGVLDAYATSCTSPGGAFSIRCFKN